MASRGMVFVYFFNLPYCPPRPHGSRDLRPALPVPLPPLEFRQWTRTLPLERPTRDGEAGQGPPARPIHVKPSSTVLARGGLRRRPGESCRCRWEAAGLWETGRVKSCVLGFASRRRAGSRSSTSQVSLSVCVVCIVNQLPVGFALRLLTGSECPACGVHAPRELPASGGSFRLSHL